MTSSLASAKGLPSRSTTSPVRSCSSAACASAALATCAACSASMRARQLALHQIQLAVQELLAAGRVPGQAFLLGVEQPPAANHCDKQQGSHRHQSGQNGAGRFCLGKHRHSAAANRNAAGPLARRFRPANPGPDCLRPTSGDETSTPRRSPSRRPACQPARLRSTTAATVRSHAWHHHWRKKCNPQVDIPLASRVRVSRLPLNNFRPVDRSARVRWPGSFWPRRLVRPRAVFFPPPSVDRILPGGSIRWCPIASRPSPAAPAGARLDRASPLRPRKTARSPRANAGQSHSHAVRPPPACRRISMSRLPCSRVFFASLAAIAVAPLE